VPPTRRSHDRRGRGPRGRLAPGEVEQRLRLRSALPLARSRSQQFDDLVLDAVERVEQRLDDGLDGVEFAVEEVPPLEGDTVASDGDVLADGDVPLSRVVPAGPGRAERRAPPRIVVYRRPVEARAPDPLDLGDLVLDIVVEQVARLLGVDPDELDPHPHPPPDEPGS
jgi:predicted Zn-dependent protease with MMP-like domain